MTENDRKYAIECIDYQLENGFLDFGCYDQDELEVIKEAMSALKVFEQVRWERDIAISQLEKLGLGLGQKVNHVKELIEKNKEKEAVDKSKNPTDWHVMHCPTCDRIFWNSGQFMHYEPKYCEKCGQKMIWKKNPYSVG